MIMKLHFPDGWLNLTVCFKFVPRVGEIVTYNHIHYRVKSVCYDVDVYMAKASNEPNIDVYLELLTD